MPRSVLKESGLKDVNGFFYELRIEGRLKTVASILVDRLLDPETMDSLNGSVSRMKVLENVARMAECQDFSTKAALFKLTALTMPRCVHHYTTQLLNLSQRYGLRRSKPLPQLQLPRHRCRAPRDMNLTQLNSILKKVAGHHSVFEVGFVGEEGSGTGPTLEFFRISAQLLSTSPNWVTLTDGSHIPTVGIKSDDKAAQQFFTTVGRFIAKAIIDERTVDFRLSPLFWKMIMEGENNLTLHDLVDFDSDYAKFLFDLKSGNVFSNSEIEDMSICFTFCENTELPLCKEGNTRQLEAESVPEYIASVLQVFRKKLFSFPVKWFSAGFNQVLPITRLKLFDPREVEMLYCGADIEEYWTVGHLRAALVPSHGFTSESATFIFLLEYLEGLDPEMRTKFLTFVTGSQRLPLGGFKALEPKLTVVEKKSSHSGELPSVMTCQNYLKVPRYENFILLKTRFDLALEEGQHSFTLS